MSSSWLLKNVWYSIIRPQPGEPGGWRAIGFAPIRLSDRLSVTLIMQHFVRGTLVLSLCHRGLKLHTVKEYILLLCNVEVSVWTLNGRHYGRLNLDEFEIFWDICTAQKDYAYIVTLWWLRCVDDYVKRGVRKTVCERRGEKDVVRKTL